MAENSKELTTHPGLTRRTGLTWFAGLKGLARAAKSRGRAELTTSASPGTREHAELTGSASPGTREHAELTGSASPGTREHAELDVIQSARPERRAAHSTRARRIRARKAPAPAVPEDDEDHFVPPAPPPLPKLDPMAKGAWAALFGGPGYLVVATAAGWSVPGIAAFCAVAAFVTGFAILVLRMNDPGPGGPDDGDDGAVV
jgi:hypothetical protein